MSKNPYTDNPKQWDNLFLGSFQLLGWLFFKPSAWRNYVKQVAPDLDFDFCLTQITWEKWLETGLWRTFIQGYVILPIFSVGLIWIFLNLFIGNAITTSTGFIIAGSLGFSISCSLAFGIVSGAAIGAIGSLFLAIIGAVLFYQPELSQYSIAIWCFIIGMIGNIIITLPSEKISIPFLIGGTAIGIFVGLFGTVFLVSIPLTIVGITETVHIAITVLTLLSIAIISISCPTKNKIYLIIAIFIVVYSSIAFTSIGFTGGIAKGLVYGTVIGACLAIPYIATNKLLKENSIVAAGAVSSALVIALLWGFISGYLYYEQEVILQKEAGFLNIVETMFPFLIIGILSALLGLTFSWWRSIIMWPFLIQYFGQFL
ncbi:hypothetical protein QUF50_01265 [Thiotrichales bacterium HSG1]|nr:hypothetical protein [Thiotrichales bacterium HSG1]